MYTCCNSLQSPLFLEGELFQLARLCDTYALCTNTACVIRYAFLPHQIIEPLQRSEGDGRWSLGGSREDRENSRRGLPHVQTGCPHFHRRQEYGIPGLRKCTNSANAREKIL